MKQKKLEIKEPLRLCREIYSKHGASLVEITFEDEECGVIGYKIGPIEGLFSARAYDGRKEIIIRQTDNPAIEGGWTLTGRPYYSSPNSFFYKGHRKYSAKIMLREHCGEFLELDFRKGKSRTTGYIVGEDYPFI